MDGRQKNQAIRQQIGEFIRHLEVERRYAKNTCEAYQRDLDKLLNFMCKNDLKLCTDLTEKHFNLLVMELHSHNLSGRSIRRIMSAIRGFLNYLMASGVLKNNAATATTSPKMDKKLPQILNYADIEKILKSQHNSADKKRNLAIFEVIYSCGLRVSELVGLNIEDIDDGFLRVLGKGAKWRTIPLGSPANIAIKAYLQQSGHFEGALFINQKRLRISTRSVQNIVKKMALDAGIKINVYPHMLRHAAATHFLQSSHDLRSTQEFLGHESIKSTQVYTHLDFLELAKVYDKHHPRAKK